MLLTLVLTSLLAMTQPASVVETFYERWAAGDPRAMELWVAGSPAAAEFERVFARTRRTRCMQLQSLDVMPAEDGTLLARVGVVKWSAAPGTRPITDTFLSRVTLDANGRIASIRSVEDERVAMMSDASDRERLRILEECGDDCRTYAFVHALNRRANLLINQQQHTRTAQLLDLAESIARDIADDRAIANTLGTRSALARIISAGEEAVRFGEAAVAHAERTRDPDAIARALLRHGRAHVLYRTRVHAQAIFARGFALEPHIEDASVAALTATQLASMADWMFQRRDALYYSMRALELSEQTPEPAPRVSAELNLAGAYLGQGHHLLSIKHFEAALQLARDAKQSSIVVNILLQLASLHHGTDEKKALALLDEALALADVTASDSTHYYVVTTRGALHRRAGRLDAAERDAREALRLVERTGNRTYIISALSELAFVHLAQKRLDDALRVAQQVERLIAELDPRDRPIARAIAPVLNAMGRTDEALQYVRTHVASMDEQIAQFPGNDVQKRALYDERAATYLFYIDLLLQSGDMRSAWLALQRTRSQIVQGAAERSTKTRGDDERHAREARIIALNKAIADPKNARKKKALRRELEQARLELDDYTIRAAVGASASEQRTDPVPVVPDGVAVVEYVVLDNEVVAFVVAHGDVQPVRIPVKRLTLERRIEAFASQIAARDQNYGEEARALYDLLLRPVEKSVRGQTLAIIPHSVLWRLPFHALRTRNGRHVAEEQDVFYAPSLALLAPRERSWPRAQKEVLAFANPRLNVETDRKFRAVFRGTNLGPLPHAEQEVQALQRIYGRDKTRIYTGAAARESVFKAEAGRYRILHVATHGVLDDSSPLYSAVLLADDAGEDGLLEAREILDMRLNADLAVLAACDTARGDLSHGEGVVGMSWALLLAGCPTVAVSQWVAESAATAKLMIRFHEILAAGQSPAAAMRRAQRDLMRDPRYAHPFYWAAFVVVGAGDERRAK